MSEQVLNNLSYIGIFLGILIGTFLVAFFVNRFMGRMIIKSSALIRSDPTNYQFLRHTLVALIYVVGFSFAIYMMPNLRTLAGSLLAGAGILAVAVGFASQHALANIISGVFIVIFKPFRVNDRLKIKEMNGVVEDITLRHTVIRDFENRRILIPNAIISDEIIVNADFEDERICKWIDVHISYGSNIDRAREILKEEVLAHPMNIDPRTPEQIEKGDELVPVRVLSLGEYSLHLRAWAWAKDNADAFRMGCDLFESIKKRFDQEEEVEIPYPHRVFIEKKLPGV